MREPSCTPIEELRRAVERLPRQTRVAMLEGIERNEIIAGAYSDSGGVCPMLAAHRLGGRTTAVAFARAWDRFAFRATRRRARRRARRVTARELLTLRAHLQASLLEPAADPHPDDWAAELAAGVADHRRLVAERRERERRRASAARQVDPARRPATVSAEPSPGEDRDRSRELRDRCGWAWSAVVRRYDEWTAVLHRHGERSPDVGSSLAEQRIDPASAGSGPGRPRALLASGEDPLLPAGS